MGFYLRVMYTACAETANQSIFCEMKNGCFTPIKLYLRIWLVSTSEKYRQITTQCLETL
jgi:hypothetical protein